MTGRTSRKGRLLARAGRFSLCAQPADVDRDIRPLARRYLGIEMGYRYIEETRNLPEHADQALTRMRTKRWLTADYEKAFGSS